MTASARGGRALTAAAIALCVLVSSTCTPGLLDLVAFQVLSNESAMLYLGYEEVDGFGVARLGVSTGALEVFRETISAGNSFGCSVSVDPRPEVPGVFMPKLYYAAEAPNRIMTMVYGAVESPAQAFIADPAAATNCVRVNGSSTAPFAVWWSTLNALHVSNELGGGGTTLNLGNGIITSFDVDQVPNPNRIYYLGLRSMEPESYFGIKGINKDGTGDVTICNIGHYVISNLLLVDGYLYYVTQNPSGIYRIKADGNEPPTLFITPAAAPQAVAFDKIDGALYWIEADETTPRRIMKAAANQTVGVPLLENLPKVDPNGFSLYRP